MTVGERFWTKIAKGARCWLWRSCVDKNGYGTFWVNERTRCARAHRLAWEMHNGAIPAGLCVLHRCDTPGCVRPDHLFLGTDADNQRDMIAKGRRVSSVGSAHQNAKLNEQVVIEARQRVSGGAESIASLARRTGVHYMVMFKAVHGLTWQHVEGAV